MTSVELVEKLYTIMPTINHKFFHEVPKLNIPKQQLRLLHTIRHHDGKPMKFFSDEMNISKPNLTKLVDQLISQGWVRRGNLEEDRRIIILSITEAGREELTKHFNLMKERTSELFDCFTEKERKELLAHFMEIKKLMDKIEYPN